MKTSLKIEELSQFILGIVLFSQLDYAWRWFPVLLFLPNIGMLEYLANTKMRGVTNNLSHNKAITTLLCGMFLWGEFYTLVGIMLFSHSSFDRALGYGLKYPDSFNNTHLGKIGKQ